MSDDWMSVKAKGAEALGEKLLIGILLFSAVVLAILGTILPGLMELPDPGGLILAIAFYAAAAGDVAVALWFRSRLKGKRPSGGTVQRQ